jgi:microsomal dipeptidase-like Zn-dependent dipeptidase
MSETNKPINLKDKLIESIEATGGLLVLLESHSKMLIDKDKSDPDIDKFVRAKEAIIELTERMNLWNFKEPKTEQQ